MDLIRLDVVVIVSPSLVVVEDSGRVFPGLVFFPGRVGQDWGRGTAKLLLTYYCITSLPVPVGMKFRSAQLGIFPLGRRWKRWREGTWIRVGGRNLGRKSQSCWIVVDWLIYWDVELFSCWVASILGSRIIKLSQNIIPLPNPHKDLAVVMRVNVQRKRKDSSILNVYVWADEVAEYS